MIVLVASVLIAHLDRDDALHARTEPALEGVVHFAGRLLREIDGPMLRAGLQGFHGGRIAMPRRPQDRPDPHRLELRFGRFERFSA